MDVLPQFVPDRGSSRTLTEQLAEGIHDAIAAGSLVDTDPLPPTRALAATLGVSRSVVVGAYERLIGENLLEATPGSGTRVAVGAALQAGRGSRSRHERLDRLPGTPFVDLRSGHPFVSAEPPRAWSRALIRAARAPWSSQSPPPRGSVELRARLATHTRLHRGLRCDADDVLVTSGTSEALVLLASALRRALGRSPRVAIEDPGYRSGSDALEAAGASLVPLRVGPHGVSLAEIRTVHARLRLDAVMLTPSHQYPLGGSLASGEREAMLTWASEHGVLLIEDDYDSEFRHSGPAVPALASGDKHGVVAYVASLNKILSPSLRCGMVVLPAPGPLRDALLWARVALGASVSEHTQTALAEFIGSGAFARAVARNKREYQHRRATVLAVLAEHGIEALASEGGLHLVVRTSTSEEASLVADRLQRRGILVETIAEFSRLPCAGGGIVFGYGAESLTRLLHGVRALSQEIIGLPVIESSGIPIDGAVKHAG